MYIYVYIPFISPACYYSIFIISIVISIPVHITLKARRDVKQVIVRSAITATYEKRDRNNICNADAQEKVCRHTLPANIIGETQRRQEAAAPAYSDGEQKKILFRMYYKQSDL